MFEVVKDGSGRVTIKELDDRGEPELYVSNTEDCRGTSVFTEKIAIPFRRIPDAKKGSYVLGLLLVAAQVTDGSGADTVALEANVLGYVGSAPTVIRRMVFGPGASLQAVRFDVTDTFERVALEARVLVNGVPDGTTVITAASLQASGRFYR